MHERPRSPRFRFDGEAIWRVGSVEHRVGLLDLSIGGATLVDPQGLLRPSDRLRLTLVIEGAVALVSLEVEVVCRAERRVEVRFANPSSGLLKELQRLTADRTP